MCVQLRGLHNSVQDQVLSSTQTNSLVSFMAAVNALLPETGTVSCEADEEMFCDAQEHDGEEGVGDTHGDGTLVPTDSTPSTDDWSPRT